MRVRGKLGRWLVGAGTLALAGCFTPYGPAKAPVVADVAVVQDFDAWLGELLDVVVADAVGDAPAATVADAAQDVQLEPDVPSQDLPPGPDVAPAFDITSTAIVAPVFPPDACTDCGWSQMPDMDGPRQNFKAAWSGTDLYFWGGEWGTQCCNDLLATGARWNPKSNLWTALPQAPLYATIDSQVVWGGDRLYVYPRTMPGAQSSGPTPWSPSPAIAAMYFPDKDLWKPMPQSSTSPMHRNLAAAVVWTGTTLIVWGGQVEGDAPGGSYDPTADSWTPLPAAPIPEGQFSQFCERGWTGKRLFVWNHYLKVGMTWTPSSATWAQITPPSPSDATFGNAAVGIPGGVFLTSTADDTTYLGWFWWEDGAIWQPVLRPTWLKPGLKTQTIWTGKYLFMWTGHGSTHGVLYDPLAGSWQPTVDTPEPIERIGDALATSGSEVFLLGGMDGPGTYNVVHADAWRFKLPP